MTTKGRFNFAYLYNKSGGAVTKGMTVIVDASNDSAFTTSTTAGDTRVIGVVEDASIADNALGLIRLIAGAIAESVPTDAAVTRGHFVKQSTTAGKVTDTTTAIGGAVSAPSGAVGVALTGVGVAGNIVVWLFPAFTATGSTGATGAAGPVGASPRYVRENELPDPPSYPRLPSVVSDPELSLQLRRHGVQAAKTTDVIGSGASEAVVFDAADTEDTDGYHDPSSANTRFTVPAGLAGLYVLQAQGFYTEANTTGKREIGIRIDGATYIAVNQFDPDGSVLDPQFGAVAVYPLAAAQYAEVMSFQSSGGNRNFDATFRMYRIGP